MKGIISAPVCAEHTRNGLASQTMEAKEGLADDGNS